ncbi:FcoT family thioesterase [Nocardia iowensis]|uniref:FcoT family thioesterase n=1 Tax=Nocardia iowensis TaxID=204891 RepID=A0ABX8RP78_NOCIO|nr:FcoT family thioesterase [Nocardia iowensis]QXN90210.1 FcoT family thioesterase [Nocardia iowensis]
MNGAVFPNDPGLLSEVLRCYKPHCRYLRELAVEARGERVTAAGTFEIPESCYIDATGHLNSVEVNICYNQMLYQTVAVLVRHRVGPLFSDWTMDDYWRRQLPDILITRLDSEYRRPIDPRRFFGEFSLDGSQERTSKLDGAPFTSLDTSFRCWDDEGGQCAGTVRLAIVNAAKPLDAAR